jgi:CRISPR type I-E-associated protein CasB/Cse2
MTAPAAPATAGLTKAEKFVDSVLELARRDPGRRAQLRRGLRLPPERAVTMHAVVAPWLDQVNRPSTERAYYVVAAMIADQTRSARDDTAREETPPEPAIDGQQPRPPRPSNVGESLAEAVRRERGLARNSAEKRLHLLVRQDLDGVHRQLPGLVRHLRTIGVPVDWVQLLRDLSRWPYDRDRVTKAWLQSFYRALPDHLTDTTQTSEEDR